jgi:hypothetical protein
MKPLIINRSICLSLLSDRVRETLSNLLVAVSAQSITASDESAAASHETRHVDWLQLANLLSDDFQQSPRLTLP